MSASEPESLRHLQHFMPPLKIGIVGGGPSAFYTASRLLHHLPTTDFRVHIYDRLWAPHGLVRYGVAADHPEVKNCIHKFDQVASDSRVRFFGNVEVSADPPLSKTAIPLPLQTMFPYYTHLVFATGSPLPRFHARLPQSQFCIPALDLVYWYTMHPLSKYKPPESPIPEGTSHITLIGHGNVSLDIARLLSIPPSHLAPLDIPSHVIRSLEGTWNTLRHISIVGRRGASDVRFTAKELREMMTLQDTYTVPISHEIIQRAERSKGDAESGGLSRQQERLLKILKDGSKLASPKAERTFSIDFWRSPVGYEITPAEKKRVLLQLEETELEPDRKLVGTGSIKKMETDLIVTSLGFESDPGLLGADLPWYDKSVGHIRTQPAGGRILSAEGHVVPNMYAAGWAGRGARGVLAGTMLDANDVAATVVQDWRDGPRATSENATANADLETISTITGTLKDLTPVASAWPVGGLDSVPPVVETGLQDGRVVTYEFWRRIDEEERNRGKGKKERERLPWEDVHKLLLQSPH